MKINLKLNISIGGKTIMNEPNQNTVSTLEVTRYSEEDELERMFYDEKIGLDLGEEETCRWKIIDEGIDSYGKYFAVEEVCRVDRNDHINPTLIYEKWANDNSYCSSCGRRFKIVI